jgi:hypothetical protein
MDSVNGSDGCGNDYDDYGDDNCDSSVEGAGHDQARNDDWSDDACEGSTSSSSSSSGMDPMKMISGLFGGGGSSGGGMGGMDPMKMISGLFGGGGSSGGSSGGGMGGMDPMSMISGLFGGGSGSGGGAGGITGMMDPLGMVGIHAGGGTDVASVIGDFLNPVGFFASLFGGGHSSPPGPVTPEVIDSVVHNLPEPQRSQALQALAIGYATKEGKLPSGATASSVHGSGPVDAQSATPSGAPVESGGGQPVQAEPTKSFDDQWASTLNSVSKYFDLLDTAAGSGGKDGLIGRCDLEAALKNPDLPQELKDACKFLLDNPAAFNELETAAGIGDCDGLIGKCDVDAALTSAPKSAPAETTGTSNPGQTTGTSSAQNSDGSSSTTSSSQTTGGSSSNDDTGSTTSSTSSTSTSDQSDFANMSVDQIVQKVIAEINGDLDSQIKDVANQLKAAEKKPDNSSEISELQLKLQDLVGRRKDMFDLLSNFDKVENEMASRAISNLGAI